MELALKGLEAERARIDSEMTDLQKQLDDRSPTRTRERQTTTAPRKRSNLTAAGRKKLSDMMKRRWAERRKEKAGR
jgi:hypothetical protein